MLVIVLLYLVARRRTWWTVTAGAIAYAGLLWTHTRAAYLALALGLVVLAVAQRRFLPVALAVASLVIGVGFVKAFPHIGPSTSYTQAELDVPARQGPAESRRQRRPAQRRRRLDRRATCATSATGIRTVVHHPLGFGLGNAGVSASRTGVELKAGESTYTELGVEIGVAGLAVFLAWMAAVLLALWRRSAWLSAAWVAMLAIGVQTDVIGVHWIAYVLFALAGAAIGGGLPDDDDARGGNHPRMKALAARIGLYRVAALLVGCALVIEICRTQLFAGNTVATIACTFGEVVFLAAAAGVFVLARRSGTDGRYVRQCPDGEGIRRRARGRGGRAAARGARGRAAGRRARGAGGGLRLDRRRAGASLPRLGRRGRPDELFDSGAAYGITVVRRAAAANPEERLKPLRGLRA